jgi:AcrR family transcriptional regulator
MPRKRRPSPPDRPADGRVARRVETREKIRAAAWALFTKHGYEATTTSAIAKRAGVAAGTVFIHASDKADLLCLVMVDRLADVVEERYRTLPDGPLLERLLYVFEGLFRSYAEHPKVAAAFVATYPGARGPNAREMSNVTVSFTTRLGLLVAEAQFRKEVAADIDPLAAGQNLFALYFMALLVWLSEHATLEQALDPLLRNALALQIRGLRP